MDLLVRSWPFWYLKYLFAYKRIHKRWCHSGQLTDLQDPPNRFSLFFFWRNMVLLTFQVQNIRFETYIKVSDLYKLKLFNLNSLFLECDFSKIRITLTSKALSYLFVGIVRPPMWPLIPPILITSHWIPPHKVPSAHGSEWS